MARKKVEEVSSGLQAMRDFADYAKQFEVYSERETEVFQLMMSVMMREHFLLKSQPGTAKSELTMRFLGGIEGAKIFKQQFTAFMDESYIFGPPILDELKQGRVVHNTVNSLVDADFAFLDEFFNANEEMIVACNEVLNERTFTRNCQKEVSPLITAVMTTNQDRETEKKLKPIYDRIMFNSHVARVADGKARVSMYRNSMNGSLNVAATFSMDKIRAIHEYIEETDVEFPDYVLELFDEILKDYQDQANEFISDRKAVKSLRYLKILALLKGSTKISVDDLYLLNKLWIPNNEVVQLSAFDACFTKIKKRYKEIEEALKKQEELKKEVAYFEEQVVQATGHADIKKLKAAVKLLQTKLIDEKAPEALKYSLDAVSLVIEEKLVALGESIVPGAEKSDEDWFAALTSAEKTSEKKKGKSKAEEILED